MIIPLILIAASLLFIQQAYAYTFFEFQIRNEPLIYDHIIYSARDQTTGDEYKWLEFRHGETYSQLEGARDALHDPQIEYDEPEVYPSNQDGNAALFIIDRTLKPGTPLTMCVSYNNNEICEFQAVAKGYYNQAVLEVDFNSTQYSLAH